MTQREQAQQLDVVGQVVGGNVAGILVREKSGKNLELGDLLVSQLDMSKETGGYLILKVVDLLYASQIPNLAIQLAAGLRLEGYSSTVDFIDPKLRNYTVATLKSVARVGPTGEIRIPKVLPSFFSSVRYATKEDLSFLATPPKNPVFLGNVRSGSKVLDIDVYLDGESFFTHHVLIPATTGRGKSNLVKTMLWSALDQAKFGILVLDPHDEYYGRIGVGLRDHPNAKKSLVYYSSDAPSGANTLVINLRTLEPEHFQGIVEFTDAQDDAITLYESEHREEWIEQVILGDEIEGVSPRTLSVLQRKLKTTLGISARNGEVVCDNEAFSTTAGESTLRNISQALEEGKIVVVDTSRLSDEAELMIGSIIANEVFFNHRDAKGKGRLDDMPAVSIVVEEAPRVLSEDKIEQSGNIYSTIAREGRKFKVGLVAITQLSSVIPKMILTNLNTKIILGNEMAPERRAIIDSAAQDLSDEERTIASLDKGEAIVSSIFTKFAIPIYTPLFETVVSKRKKKLGSEFDLDGKTLALS